MTDKKYKVEKSSIGWLVVEVSTGNAVGEHKTRNLARMQAAALNTQDGKEDEMKQTTTHLS